MRVTRAICIAATITTTLLVTGAVPAGAATKDSLISAADIGSVYAASGQTVWLHDNSGAGTATVTTDAFDGRSAIKMEVTGPNDQVNIFKSYGVDVRPTNVADLLAGSSFSYAGASVNFQLAMFYTPKDVDAYGPSGTTAKCSQEKDNNVPVPNWCYTTIKFEPGVASGVDAYATTTLADKQQPHLIAGGGVQPGWWNTQQAGIYPANSSATLDQLLGGMASYEIYAVGASVGKQSPAANSWLLNLTFGGTSYSFGTAPIRTAPKPPPATDSAALAATITAQKVNVTADTAKFDPSGTTTSLAAVDPAKPFTGTYAGWADPTDAFVDVYIYSNPAFIGTFPIVDGNIVMSKVDLSALTAGGHQLVIQGQTSKTIAVVALTVVAAASTTPSTSPAPSSSTTVTTASTTPRTSPTTSSSAAATTASTTPSVAASSTGAGLANTGVETKPYIAVAVLLLLIGLAVIVVARRRRSTH